MPFETEIAILEVVKTAEKKTFDQCYALNARLIDAFQGLIDTNIEQHSELEKLQLKCAELEYETKQLNESVQRERDISHGMLAWVKDNFNTTTFDIVEIDSLKQYVSSETQRELEDIFNMVSDDRPDSAKDIAKFLQALFIYHAEIRKRYDQVKARNEELMVEKHIKPLAQALSRTCIVLQGAMHYMWDHIGESQLVRQNPSDVATARHRLQVQVVSVTAGYIRVQHIIDRLWPKDLGDLPYNRDYHAQVLETGATRWINKMMDGVREELERDPRAFDNWMKEITKGSQKYYAVDENVDYFGILP